MSKQQRLLDDAMEQDNIIKLLDDIYEEEQFMREAHEYGYYNHSTYSNNYNMYMAVEYGYLAS